MRFVLAAFCLGYALSSAHASAAGPTSVSKHKFSKGESYTYFFENTEASYATTPGPVVPKVSDLILLEEIKVSVKMEIVSVDDEVTKRVTLTDVSYRKQTPDDIKLRRAVPFTPIQELTPGFPASFSYTYKVKDNDGEVESSLGGFFKDFMSNQVGMFLYYKMQDFHAFHGSADGVALKGLGVGDSTLSNPIEIQLEHGVFHNAPILTIFSRLESLTQEAYFKSVVMGNSYDMKQPSPLIDTNYQYSFYVSLAGKYAGLPTRGEMNETIFTTDRSSKSVKAIQRMVSLKIVEESH